VRGLFSAQGAPNCLSAAIIAEKLKYGEIKNRE
jgi:hypothetical protein